MDRKQFRINGRGGGKNNKSGFKNLGFLVLIVLFGLIIYAAFNQPNQLTDVPFSQVVSQANSGQITKITVSGDELQITPKGQSTATEKSFKEPGSSIYEQGLQQGKVELVNKPSSASNGLWLTLLGSVLPVVLIGIFLMLMLRSAQGQGNQALSFGKSRARLYGSEKDRVTFANVAGNDEAKQDLSEVVEFLKYPKKFEGVGAKIPKGVLLVGPPGKDF